MITLNSIRATIVDWLEDDSDTALIDRTINTQLRYLVKGNLFESLIRSDDITPTAEGVILSPPVCDSILGIYNLTTLDDTPNIEFFPIAHRDVSTKPRTNNYKYRPIGATTVAGDTGLNLTGTLNDTILLQAGGTAVTADMVGKELKLAGDPTRYLITGAVAATSLDVFPPLRVSATGGVSGIVNPTGMKQYVLQNQSGTPYTDDVTVDYKVDHPPLINDDDELIVPMERTLSLMTVQHFLRTSKYDVDADRLENAVFEAMHVEFGDEPTSEQENAPQNTMFAYRSMRGHGRTGRSGRTRG